MLWFYLRRVTRYAVFFKENHHTRSYGNSNDFPVQLTLSQRKRQLYARIHKLRSNVIIVYSIGVSDF